MRYFISGLCGFVGSHMADFLIKKEIDSIIYGIKRWRSDTANVKHLLDNRRVTFLEADLLDRNSLDRSLQIAKPDVIYHFASQSSPQASFKVPVKTLMTNVIGTTNLLESIRINSPESLIISISSSEVYGQPLKNEIPIKETNPFRAANPYSISKTGHDFISQYYRDAFGLKIIITRLFSHEGARRSNEFALSGFAFQIVKHEKNYINDKMSKKYIYVGNLESIRTYSHVSDAVLAYYLCKEKGKIGEIYNISGNDVATVGDALELLLKKSIIPRDKFDIIIDPERIRPTDITLQIADCSKFKKDTGWEPKKGLREICEDLLSYWREQL